MRWRAIECVLVYFAVKQIFVFPYFINRASQFKTKVPAVILSRYDDSIQPHVVHTGPFQKDSLQAFVQENKLPRLVSTLSLLFMLGNVSCYCCCLLTFSKLTFFQKLFQEQTVCQMAWIQIRTDILSSVGPDLGYSETCLKRPLKKRQNKGLKAMWYLNAGQ